MVSSAIFSRALSLEQSKPFFGHKSVLAKKSSFDQGSISFNHGSLGGLYSEPPSIIAVMASIKSMIKSGCAITKFMSKRISTN